MLPNETLEKWKFCYQESELRFLMNFIHKNLSNWVFYVTYPNSEQWKYVNLDPTPFGTGTPTSANVPCDFLYASYLNTKHNNKPGITISPKPSIEKCPLLCMLGNTNLPGKFNFGVSLT